ncbi:MAG: CpaD family pilus assembly protein [Rhizobiales bacterium]|nr:CpaD family pilus assembly protein [Hyphomicrobiales bacterium]
MSVLSRKSLTLVALVAGLGLAGCAHDDLALDDAYVPLSPEERFPIEYSKGPVTMEVATSHGALQPGQVNAVARFARQSLSGGVSPIVIQRPAGGGASARVAEDVASLVLRQGVPRSMIRMGTYPAPASAPVRIGYVKAMAHTAPCGNWSMDAANEFKNEQMPNHGCAVQANIAAMLANPQDVVTPQPMSPAQAASGTAAIKKISNGQSSASSMPSIFGF